MDFLWRGAKLEGPPDVTMHCALGADSRGGSQLHQLRGLLVERSSLLCGGSQGINRLEKIGVLKLQTPKGAGFYIPAYHS